MVGAIAAGFFVAAILYASVGHAGASGYLAVMALFGVASATMKPTALVLNILVASIGTVQFARAGCFSWRLFWPFALGSAPFAYLGGALPATGLYRPTLGVVLVFAAWRMFVGARAAAMPLRPHSRPLAVGCGAAIGLLSGWTGVGGGIFLSPLVILLRWAEPRQTAGVSAAFILVNSCAGLLGHLASLEALPPALPWWAGAAAAGGALGATYGSRRLGGATLRRLLAVVLLIAGLKLLFSA